MHFSLTAILLTTASLFSLVASTCNLDNCYNNLAHYSASTFCSTYTTAINTALTGLPSYVSTSCGSSRLSSACSCLYPASGASTTSSCQASQATKTVTVTRVSTTTVASVQPACILRNGDFGLDPWVNEDIINESSYGYNTPTIGGPAYSGTAAFSVSFPADGIYELDQHVTFPSTSIPLTLTFYAKSNTTGCSIIAVFGIRGGAYFAEKQVQLTTNYAVYSVSGTTDGETLGFVALEVQCSGSTGGSVVLIDGVALG
ncbi:uncharacterized protein PAC_15865 [Phialocephala subalpina]|uniref:CBM-cenC domain-containing protein n=1 Tax=Phialocephala subalpina TaxID=576137 RepID=A0A1L7XLN9_9HELO|nr:uncharacterized protein PAC_15865 [Phialocephala subalpina]